MRTLIAALPLVALVAACAETTALVEPVDPPLFSSQGVQKFDLVGPAATLFCTDLEPHPTLDDATLWQEGFATFSVNGAGTLQATILLKGAAPNTDYPVRLIQGEDDCYTVDGVLTTNRNGTGTLRLQEPALTGRAQVIIDTGAFLGRPTYRATDMFVY